PLLAGVVGLLFALAAFLLPLLAARATASAGSRLSATTAGLRIAALDTLTGLREVRAFGADGRMLATVQAREAAMLSAPHAVAGRSALAACGAFLCGQASILAVLLAAGTQPAVAVTMAFLTVAAFEAIAGLPRAGALAGYAVSAAERVLSAAEAP